jgi:hypothetical protein
MNCDNCKFIFWCRFKRDMQKMGAKITSCPDYKPREEINPHDAKEIFNTEMAKKLLKERRVKR